MMTIKWIIMGNVLSNGVNNEQITTKNGNKTVIKIKKGLQFGEASAIIA